MVGRWGRGAGPGRSSRLGSGKKAGKGSADSTEHPESFRAFRYEHEQVDGAAAKGRVSVWPGDGGGDVVQFRGQFQYICNMLK